MCEKSTCYELNERLEIVSVGGTWQVFAEANGGHDLDASRICGRSLWDFVQGDVTRIFLNSIFQKVISFGTAIAIPYRCDSPELKRHMRMLVRPAPSAGHLLLEHEILYVEARSAALHFHFEPEVHPDRHLRCSICGRMNVSDRWFDPAESLGSSAASSYLVTYSVCQDCRKLASTHIANSGRVALEAW
jgi:hypothetical protein